MNEVLVPLPDQAHVIFVRQVPGDAPRETSPLVLPQDADGLEDRGLHLRFRMTISVNQSHRPTTGFPRDQSKKVRSMLENRHIKLLVLGE